MNYRLRRLIDRAMLYSRNMDMRIRRPGRMVIISLGCLAAAFLSGWSYYSLVFVGAALGLTTLAYYIWPRSRRRSGQPGKKAGVSKDLGPKR